jgi:hypothetical protein
VKLATSLAFLAAFVVAQDTGTIEGVVVNKVTGAGIGGATVRFVAPKAIASRQSPTRGLFTFPE